MPDLTCTSRRIGDYESRTEEYELSFALGDTEPRKLEVKYQAARAFEINAALDSAVETAREAISVSNPDLAGKPTDESLAKFSWRAVQSVKYDEGASKTSHLPL
ncbi:MAG: hypothetical protein ACR2GU_08490 [Rubrobacteraceae bacterium]